MTRQYKLLGPLEVVVDGQPSALLKRPKASALMAYLIVVRQPRLREELADLFWEATSTAEALRNLRTTLARIRATVPELRVSRTALAFVPGPDTWVDYLALEAVLDQPPNLDADEAGVARLEAALALYRGDLLDGLLLSDAPRFHAWLVAERERLHQRVISAYAQLCRAHVEAHRWSAGLTAARRWQVLSPLDEVALRLALQCLAELGTPTLGLQEYQNFSQRLQAEVAVEPEPATTQLADQLERLADEHARQLDLELVTVAPPALPELGELPDPGPLPPGSRLPHARNPDFTGRENDLLRLADLLLPRTPVAPPPVAAITGLGGLGKTQLAVEFAYRFGRYFPGGVHWLSFADPDSVPEAVAATGGEMGLVLFQDADDLNLTDRVGRVQRAWQDPLPRLLIFDACESETLLAAWRPVTGGCRILLTSRRSTWSRELGVQARLLAPFEHAQSVALLQRLAPQLDLPNALSIAQAVGDLPLALHLAGSFLARYPQISPADYLSQLRAAGPLDHPSLQGRGVEFSPTSHELHVARTLALSLAQLEATNETERLARRLMAAAACLAPGEPIPVSLLLATITPAEAGPAEAWAAEDALTRLQAQGFLPARGDRTVVMHRLVNVFTRATLGDAAPIQAVVARVLCQRLEDHIRQTGALFALPFAPAHLRYLAQLVLPRQDEVAAAVAYYLGLHLNYLADTVGSRTYLQQALDLATRHYGADHEETARVWHALGAMHQAAGRYREARAAFERALYIREGATDVPAAVVAHTVSDLGYLLLLQGDYRLARAYLERAIALAEQEPSADYPLTATNLDNLGVVLLNLGDHAPAQANLEQALSIRISKIGPRHPQTAVSLQHLGQLHLQRRNLPAAKDALDRSLQISQAALGSTHPHLAHTLNVLGRYYQTLGDYPAALAAHERALAIQEPVLAAHHPELAQTLTSLGDVEQALGHRTQAHEYFARAYHILAAHRDPAHVELEALRQRLAATT